MLTHKLYIGCHSGMYTCEGKWLISSKLLIFALVLSHILVNHPYCILILVSSQSTLIT